MGIVKKREPTLDEIKAIKHRDDIAVSEKKVNAGEKIVSIKESQELQKKGAVVIAMFKKSGVKVHKVKLPTKEKNK